jgi:hypothetical protein
MAARQVGEAKEQAAGDWKSERYELTRQTDQL